MTRKKIVVVGAGISGLVAALLLSNTKSDSSIVLIDKSEDVGGLLRCFDYGEYGYFDYGMHTVAETGIDELDELIFNLLPEEEWEILAGARRDLAGVYYNRTIHAASPYIDIRSHSPEVYRACLADFFYNIAHTGAFHADNANAREYAINRFGMSTAQLIDKVIQKLYKKESSEMDIMATMISPLGRVVLFNEDLTADLTSSAVLRDRLAYIDQRNLPLERSSNKKSYYPKQYGMFRVIDSIKSILTARGVTILTNTTVNRLKVNHNKLDAITALRAGKEIELSDIEFLYWSIGAPTLSKLLGVDYLQHLADPPLKTVVLNLLIDRQLKLGDLYYFYCYEDGFKTFRLTNYSNYCSGAYRNGGYPVSLEMLVNPSELNDPEQLVQDGLRELEAFDVLENGAKVIFKKLEILESGFPMPTLNNIAMLDSLRKKIDDINVSNVELIGILSERNLFFQSAVIADTYKKIKNYS